MPEKDFQTKGYRMVEVKNPDGTVTMKNMWDVEAKRVKKVICLDASAIRPMKTKYASYSVSKKPRSRSRTSPPSRMSSV